MNYQCKCGCDNMFIEKKGNNTGLYCSKCGKWIKWLNKNELRAFEHEQKEKEISKTIDNNLNNVYSNTNININNLNIVNNLNDFIDFLKDGNQYEMKAEYLLPTVIGDMLKQGSAKVKVLPTSDKWFGVTYKEDKDYVIESFRKLIDAGVYKAKLFD